MKLVLNNIKDLSISNINIHKDKIYYTIGMIRMSGIFLKYKKYMINNDNKYIVKLDEQMNLLNMFFNNKYRPFLKFNKYPYIEVIKNDKTKTIFNDKSDFLIIRFMSINHNNYPKIHILPWET